MHQIPYGGFIFRRQGPMPSYRSPALVVSRPHHHPSIKPSYPRSVFLVASLLVGIASGPAAAQNEAIPLEPDWSLTTRSENAPISLEDDLQKPDPAPPAPLPSTSPTPQQPEPDIDPTDPTVDPIPSLPTDPLPDPRNDEPVIGPAPEELDPDFFTRPASPPSADPDPLADESGISRENSDALLTDPIPDEESTASVAAAESIQLFRMEGAKFQIFGADIRFGLNTRFTYNDNILTSETNPTSDYVALITPTIVIGIGDVELEEENFFLLEYAPTFQRYATNTELDTVDQFFNVRTRYNLSRFSFLPGFRYIQQTDTDDEIGRRNERTTVSANLTTIYALSGKTGLQTDLSAAAYDSELGISNNVYTFGSYLLYQITDRTEITLGGSVGYVDIETGDYQTFQTLTGQLSYEGTSKLTYGLTLGAENRQSTTTVFSQSIVETGDPSFPFAFELEESQETTNELTPIFALSARYLPFDSTSLNFSASRRVSASSFSAGQVVNSTSFQLQASQRFIQRVFVEVLARYQFDEYEFESRDDRQDNIIVFQPRLRYAFHDDDYSVSLFYTYRQNQSTQTSVSYTNSIIGLEFDFDF